MQSAYTSRVEEDLSEGTPEIEIEYLGDHYGSVLKLANKLKDEEDKRRYEVVPGYQKSTFSIERKKTKKKVSYK